MSSHSGSPRLRFAHPHRSLSRLEFAMLVLLVALIVLMPVSYRAGTDTSHPHTIFQGLIDMVIGQPHYHGEHDHASDLGDSHASAEHPGGEHGEDSTDQVAERLEPAAASPDMPTLLGLSSPIDASAAIHALGALIAAMLSGSTRRSLRDSVQSLDGLIVVLEPPPPRLA